MGISLKSAFSEATKEDGKRYLVETLWPESLDSHRITSYKWLKELAPSYDLKQQASDHAWDENRFKEEYWKELQDPARKKWFDKVNKESKKGAVTLLYGIKKNLFSLVPADTTVCHLRDFFKKASA